MESLNDYVREYTAQLRKGEIQKAYKGIMAFMSGLRAYLESAHPEFTLSALYYGYMDMTYFAFTPPALTDRKLKIAVVYLHEECRFELWLAANNRKLQAEYIEALRHKNIGAYSLSQAGPGVDSVVSTVIAKQPDFDDTEGLKKRIEKETIKFAESIVTILKQHCV